MQSPPADLADLAALVLTLRAPRDLHLANHLGRAIYALGLNIIGRSNPELAQALHDHDAEKPFAVSGLMRGGEGHAPIQPVFGNVATGETAWVRLAACNREGVSALAAYKHSVQTTLAMGGRLDEQIDYVGWQVVAAEWEDGNARLPGLFRYHDLIERHRTAPLTESLTFHFYTATTFRSQGVNVPLPRPDLVFGSLLNRWVAFTQHRLRDLPDDLVSAFIQHHVVLSRCNVETALYRFKEGGKEVGFVGQATFDVLSKSDWLLKRDPTLERTLRREGLWLARTCNLLADFAQFSGVGRKTTTGMGMVR